MHFLPEILKNLEDLIKSFPLWSAIMVPYFGYGSTTISSAPLESNFNKLKHSIFAHKKLSFRVDVFVGIHLVSGRGDETCRSL